MDDMITKSKKEESYIQDLKKLFERLRKYKLRLNLANCSFRLKSGNLLGFMVNDRGIEVNPNKVKAIQSLSAPKIEKVVRRFLKRLNYIAQFISQLTTIGEPIFQLLRKNDLETQNEDCQEAFDKIEQYLHNPPWLVPSVLKRSLILYLIMTIGCVLGQYDKT